MAQHKTFEALRFLPPGSVRARGWLQQQLERNKQGLGGHLDALEPEMIAYPYVDKTAERAWGKDNEAGWGAEISGNYWYGLVQLAFTLDDKELKEKAKNWVLKVLENQEEDGYMGAYRITDNRWEDYNAWGTFSGLQALQAYYEATKETEVLEAIYRCLLWFCEHWAGENKTLYGGPLIITNMAWCYQYKEDKRLIEFIHDYFRYLDENDLYENSVTAMREHELIYNSNHAAAMALTPKYASAGYAATNRQEYLQAATNSMNKMVEKLLLPTGGLASNSEYVSPIASNTETEYCTFAFLQNTLLWLASVTGDPQYFDYSERIALNGAQGARKKDEKAIAYFTSPNQIYATSISDFFGMDMGVYAPCYPTSCCPVTSVWVVPEYLYGMAMYDKQDNLYINTYGPAVIESADLRLTTDTLYPFRDEIRYVVETIRPVEKTVNLRIPSWTKNAVIYINGQPVDVDTVPGAYASVTRRWEEGDTLTLHLPMEIAVHFLNDEDSWNHQPMVVEYGPLVFSLPIEENWTPIAGNPHTPLPEGWNWYEVNPVVHVNKELPAYETLGMQKQFTSWNVALSPTLAAEDIQLHVHEPTDYVWEQPLLTMSVPGYKALYSYAAYPRKTHVVYQSPIDVQEPLTLTLVPYGCTNLRISCFPQANI